MGILLSSLRPNRRVPRLDARIALLGLLTPRQWRLLYAALLHGHVDLGNGKGCVTSQQWLRGTRTDRPCIYIPREWFLDAVDALPKGSPKPVVPPGSIRVFAAQVAYLSKVGGNVGSRAPLLDRCFRGHAFTALS